MKAKWTLFWEEILSFPLVLSLLPIHLLGKRLGLSEEENTLFCKTKMAGNLESSPAGQVLPDPESFAYLGFIAGADPG